MKKSLRFFKLGNEWFADVEGHTLAENQMVSGSDDFLQEIDSRLGGRGEVTLTFSDVHDQAQNGPFLAKLNMISHNQWGASYVLDGPLAQQNDAVGFRLWICNVTHDVLGEHPRCIYLYDIK